MQPRIKFPHEGFEEISQSIKVEEETLPLYRAELFYPVYLGEVFMDRYQVVAKLGYGTSSTTWLCYDLACDQQYHVLKIHISSNRKNQELHILQHLQAIDSDHPGRKQVRRLEDHFTIQGPYGEHEVFVFAPLGVSVRLLQDLQPGKVYGEKTATSAVRQALLGLDFLHYEANVVHTDVHSGNLLLGLTDLSLLEKFRQNELMRPTPRKTMEGRTIYTSQMLLDAPAPPQLCDFGHARICVNDELQRGIVMPVQYRAPEVLLDMPWDYGVDLWSVGLLAWDLLEQESLFQVYNRENYDLNEAFHLAHMQSIIGPPPLGFLQRSSKSLKYEDGKWRGVVPLPPTVKLETLATSLSGQSREQFISFIGSMLRWQQIERLSTAEAYQHPWLFKIHETLSEEG